MNLALPVELVSEIIDYALAAQAPETSLTTKANWSSISPLSLASKTYRTLVLEAWFRVLRSRDPRDILFIQSNLPEIREHWTRELQCLPQGSSRLWDLAGFTRLYAIHLNCSAVNWSWRNQIPFCNVPPSVTELELADVHWPSPIVIQAVADTFPTLRTLRLRLSKIWCGLCHTCSTVKFADPVPPKLVYTEGLGLPIHYSRVMSPMQHLLTVFIFVTYHSGTHINFNPKDPAEGLWSGECDRCVGIMYDDIDFRERWMARKKGIVIRNAERTDEFRLYIKPPALETVEWVFSKSEIEETSDVEQLEHDEEDSEDEEDDELEND